MILVTGATGLVGGHLLWHLLAQHDSVVAIRRASSSLVALRKLFAFYTDSPDVHLSRIQWRVADMCDEQSIENAMHGIETIYHCAAVVSLGAGSNNLERTNVDGTVAILNAAIAHRVNRFCFVSSIAACGTATDAQLIDENTPIGNFAQRSEYARSKYESEMQVWKAIDKGLNAVIVNPGVILGYSGSDRGSSELFARVRKGLPFYTSGGSGYVDVRDVVQIMIRLVDLGVCNERFVLVAQNCSNQEVLTWMAKGYKKPVPRIKIGSWILFAVGFISEMVSKISGTKTQIDRSLARSATTRTFYSSDKIKLQLNYQFISIDTCIGEVCAFEMNSEGI